MTKPTPAAARTNPGATAPRRDGGGASTKRGPAKPKGPSRNPAVAALRREVRAMLSEAGCPAPVVARIASGDRIGTRDAELLAIRRAVIGRLHAAGCPTLLMARLFGLTRQHVNYEVRHGKAGPATIGNGH